MSTVYGEVALRAWELITAHGASPPEAWRQAVCVRYPDAAQQKNALQHTCPRGAFLGLCERGLVRNVAAGSYTGSTASSGYAFAAVGLLQAEPDLADNKAELKKRVYGTRTPNDEVEVVLALRSRDLLL